MENNENDLKCEMELLREYSTTLRESGKALERMRDGIGWWNASPKDVLQAIKIAVVGTALVFATAGIITYNFLTPYNQKEICPKYTNEINCTQTGRGEESTKFLDYKPYGSLDEVVMIQEGEVVTLNSSDKRFEKQERVYKEKIVPYLNR